MIKIWAEKNDMALNLKKCGIMNHKGKAKMDNNDK